MALMSCDAEWTKTFVVGLVFLHPMVQETLDHCTVAVLSCKVEGSSTVVVVLVLVGPLLQQMLDHI